MLTHQPQILVPAIPRHMTSCISISFHLSMVESMYVKI
uniref:Uncharacterized protein n=1 Tax=Rhizophora mucronata TaxID=61149 RepID=A0A2P2R3M0_RHIMU